VCGKPETENRTIRLRTSAFPVALDVIKRVCIAPKSAMKRAIVKTTKSKKDRFSLQEWFDWLSGVLIPASIGEDFKAHT
jgi:hypothetical protein